MKLMPVFMHKINKFNSPYYALCSGADGFQVLVTLEDSEARVADLNGIEVGVARRGRHGRGWRRRVGHGPPLADTHLTNIQKSNFFSFKASTHTF